MENKKNHYVSVPTQNSAANLYLQEAVGNKTDTTAGDSLIAISKQIVEDTGTTLSGDITAIKAITDVIPDSGAMTSIAQEATLNSAQSDITSIKNITDVLPDSGALTSLATQASVDIIDGFHDVPTADSSDNDYVRDVLGNKTDTSSGSSLVSLTKRCAGNRISKTITLDADSSAQSLNCFQVTGTVEIFKLYAFITDATTLTNCTNAQFDLYDGAAVAITKNDGVLSGLGVGSFIAKMATSATTMEIADNSNAAVTEPAADKEVFSPFFITQKSATNTYVRFTYTTADSPINAQMIVYAEYRAIDSGSLVVI